MFVINSLYLPTYVILFFFILVDELNTAFESTPEKFLEKYNIPKPDKDQRIVFSCAKGIRSLKACRHVADLGYKKYIFLNNLHLFRHDHLKLI